MEKIGISNDSGYIGSPSGPSSTELLSSKKVETAVPEEENDSINELKNAEWYWGDISKDEANYKLCDYPEGAFLVRDASKRNGEYTLTVRHGQKPKLLRINYRDGKYGLAEPCTFTSIVSLIKHYSTNSLAEYNSSLDVKLLYPVSKYEKGDGDREALIDMLHDVVHQFLIKTNYFEHHSQLLNETTANVQIKKQAVDAFELTIRHYKNQVLMQEKVLHQPSTDKESMQMLESNYEYSCKKLEGYQANQLDLMQNLGLQMDYSRLVEQEIIHLKSQISQLRNTRSRILARLGLYESSSEEESIKLCPVVVDVWDENYWLRPKMSRQEAQTILKDQPEGTFLVRKSSTGEHALSLAIKKNVVHCIIYRGMAGYGFDRKSAYFPSLRALILYYSAHSLSAFNDQLPTRLTYPAFDPQLWKL